MNFFHNCHESAVFQAIQSVTAVEESLSNLSSPFIKFLELLGPPALVLSTREWLLLRGAQSNMENVFLECFSIEFRFCETLTVIYSMNRISLIEIMDRILTCLVFTHVYVELHAFFVSNTFISNIRRKLATLGNIFFMSNTFMSNTRRKSAKNLEKNCVTSVSILKRLYD